MANVYAIDSNVYIEALRNRDQLDLLKTFLRRAGSRVALATPVAMELRAGARTDEQQAALTRLIGSYRERMRLIIGSFDSYWQAGRVLADLGRGSATPTGFVTDVALACACREAGAVLITSNARDFTRIQRRLRGFRFIPPWPLL